MFFSLIDILSPRITLYHKGILFHASLVSGILSIITICLIIAVSIYYLIELFQRKNPSAYFFQRFVENSGIFPINSSSFFHYISMATNTTLNTTLNITEGIDFSSFKIIGIEVYLNTYLQTINKNLSKIDHWLYGPCQESDMKGIKQNLFNKNVFLNSACIRKYFSFSENKYYNTDDSNFRWPRIAHGTYNLNNEFYNIFIEKCEEKTLNIIYGNNKHCKSILDFNNMISLGGGVYFNFIDHYIDSLDYKNPIKNYPYRIESSLEKENYSINHLNFNPFTIKTNNNLVIDKTKEEISYVFDRNDVFTNPQNGNGIYMNYYLWLNNRMQHYERFYKKLQDIISDIGGFGRVITIVASIINYLYNSYITLLDTSAFIYSLENNYISEKEKKDSIIIKTHIRDLHNSRSFNNLKCNLNNNNIDFNDEKNNKANLKKENETMTNFSVQNTKEEKPININKKNKFNIFTFLYYKLSCGSKYKYYDVYKNFRKKIISEEQIVKNSVNIYKIMNNNDNNMHLIDILNDI
jgi:hypothetical protein